MSCSRLVYLVKVESAADALARLGVWIRRGLEERSRLRMKRLRLVFAADDPKPVANALSFELDRLAQNDKKVHLHVIARSELAHL